MNLEKTLEKLRGAKENTANINLAIKRILDLAPCLAYAMEEIAAQNGAERSELNTEVLTNEELAELDNIEVQDEEVVFSEEILDPQPVGHGPGLINGYKASE